MIVTKPIPPERLLFEVEDVLRTTPNDVTVMSTDHAWVGRASAVISKWNSVLFPGFGLAINQLYDGNLPTAILGKQKILTMLHQCQHELRTSTTGPLNVGMGAGNAFVYFEEVRRIIELATSDVFFVDPYLNAEFVTTYLPQIATGVGIRLLARDYISKLKPAVELYCQQSGAVVKVRSALEFHDRFVFVDRASGYHSGASFKDGAKKAPTTISQVTDAFGAVFGEYERMWASATVVI
jgi:hypothetical protein